MAKLTVALATYNEEKTLRDCLDSIKEIADEIVIVDGTSSDGTVAIAREFGAKVSIVPNQKIFHINKQKALDLSSNEWILQLDADERVSKKLAAEISKVITMTDEESREYQKSLSNKDLFLRHQHLLDSRDGKIGNDDASYAAFFIPRLNYFLGRYLRHGGVYPDGVIRLVKKKQAHFPAKDVHEQIVVDGKVGWLQHDLIHMADPTFTRYLQRNSRYIDLIATQIYPKGLFGFIDYVVLKPAWWFLVTFIRHKGFLDSWQGFVFSFFSALRFPRAYFRYQKRDR